MVGRVTKEIELRYTQNGTARTIISIAVNRSVKNGEQWQEEASYFDVEIWGKVAENVQKYSGKGCPIAIQGFLKQARWEKDGKKYYKVCIVANSVQFLGSRNNGGSSGGYASNNGNNGGYSNNANNQQQQPPQYSQQPNSYEPMDDMDIPF